VFFNLLSEAEPFAAILILTELLSIGEGTPRPKGLKFEDKGREWEEVLGDWQ